MMPTGEAGIDEWPDVIVFDLDGTIADTAPDIRDALNRSLARERLPPISLAVVKTMVGAGPRVLVRRALQHCGAPLDDAIVARTTEAFHEHYEHGHNAASRLFPDVRACLERLRSLGIRMGICSNKPERFCVQLLRDLGALEFFHTVQGYGSGLPPKPDPQPLLRTIQRLGVTPDRAMYVGDSETDVATARAGGIPVAIVGHGYTTMPASELGGDWLLPTLADLPGLCRHQR